MPSSASPMNTQRSVSRWGDQRQHRPLGLGDHLLRDIDPGRPEGGDIRSTRAIQRSAVRQHLARRRGLRCKRHRAHRNRSFVMRDFEVSRRQAPAAGALSDQPSPRKIAALSGWRARLRSSRSLQRGPRERASR
jgi:hypothetical protein